MNIKRIASVTNFILTFALIVLFVLWGGSFLAEHRGFLVFIAAGLAIVNGCALATEWIYRRGEKAGRAEDE